MNELMQRANNYLALDPKPDTTLYLLTIPPLLLASLSTHVWEASAEVIYGYAIANLLSLVVVLLTFVVAGRLIQNARGNHVVAIGLFGIALGLAKGASTAVFTVVIGVESDLVQGLIDRSATPLIGLWVSLTFAFSKAALEDIERTRDLINVEEKRQQQAKSPSVPELEKLLETARQLAAHTPRDGKQLSSLILDLVNHRIRPLSRDLVTRKRISATDIWGLLSLGAASNYRPALAAGLFAASLTSPLSRAGLFNGLLGVLFVFMVSWVMLSLANLLKTKLPNRLSIQLAFLVSSSGLTGMVSVLGLNNLGLVSNPVIAIGVFSASWWLGNILVIVGMVQVVAVERRGLKKQVGRLLELKTQRSGEVESALQRRELANHLHAHVQNKLLSQALRLETAKDVDLQNEMQILLETLSSTMTIELEEKADLESVVNRWRGTIDIHTHCEVQPTPVVLAAIEEAITNAFRHGKASEVHVSLTKYCLKVSDDGLGPIGGSLGLGSLAFRQLGQWELVAGENGGSVLSIHFD